MCSLALFSEMSHSLIYSIIHPSIWKYNKLNGWAGEMKFVSLMRSDSQNLLLVPFHSEEKCFILAVDLPAERAASNSPPSERRGCFQRLSTLRCPVALMDAANLNGQQPTVMNAVHLTPACSLLFPSILVAEALPIAKASDLSSVLLLV